MFTTFLLNFTRKTNGNFFYNYFTVYHKHNIIGKAMHKQINEKNQKWKLIQNKIKRHIHCMYEVQYSSAITIFTDTELFFLIKIGETHCIGMALHVVCEMVNCSFISALKLWYICVKIAWQQRHLCIVHIYGHHILQSMNLVQNGYGKFD